MTVRSALNRHRAELGTAVAVHRSRPGAGTILLLVLVALLMPVATAVAPGTAGGVEVLLSAVWVLLVVAAYVILGGETLAVCERGLLIGSTAPFMRPYVIRYDQVTPGSVVPVTGARRYGASTGVLRAPVSIRTAPWVVRGVHLVGPSIPEARRSMALLSRINGFEARSFDGRWIWFAGTGSTPPEQVTAQIAEAAGRAGLLQLAAATAAAPPRALTGNRADRARLLPGYPT